MKTICINTDTKSMANLLFWC